MTSKRGIPMEMHKFPTSSRQLRLEPPHHLKTHSPAMFRCANQNTMVMTLVVCKKQRCFITNKAASRPQRFREIQLQQETVPFTGFIVDGCFGH